MVLVAITAPEAASEPELGDKDVDVDDVPLGHHAAHHVVHLQLQDCVERTDDGPDLANDTWRSWGRENMKASPRTRTF